MNVLTAIKRLSVDATPSERKVIDFFLDDYPVNAILNLQKIAKETNLSIPTVQRMVVKLGFEGFLDFRQAVLNDLSQQKKTSPLYRMGEMASLNAPQKHHDAEGAYQQTLNNIETTFANLSSNLIFQTAEILANKDRVIWCLGGRFTGTLATLFARHLKTLRHRVREFTPYEGALADIYADTSSETVLFVTDIRRYDKPIIKLCQAAKEKKATIILITDNWISPAEKSADIVIPVYTNSPSGWDSNACLLVVLEEIMSIVTKILGINGQKNLQKREVFLS